MKKLILICTAFILIPSCGDDTSRLIFNPEEIAQIQLTPGFHSVIITAIDGYNRTFTLWVPANIDTQPVPLVIALHGSKSTTTNISEPYVRYFIQPAFQSMNAIIIAPDVPGENWLEESSEDFIISLIKIIGNVWPVDPHRIIITGYSLGGRGAWYYADKYPELFHASVPVASRPVGFLTGKAPHYIIQGKRDEVCGVADTQKAYDTMKSKNRKVVLKLVDLSHAQMGGYIVYVEESIDWINGL